MGKLPPRGRAATGSLATTTGPESCHPLPNADVRNKHLGADGSSTNSAASLLPPATRRTTIPADGNVEHQLKTDIEGSIRGRGNGRSLVRGSVEALIHVALDGLPSGSSLLPVHLVRRQSHIPSFGAIQSQIGLDANQVALCIPRELRIHPCSHYAWLPIVHERVLLPRRVFVLGAVDVFDIVPRFNQILDGCAGTICRWRTTVAIWFGVAMPCSSSLGAEARDQVVGSPRIIVHRLQDIDLTTARPSTVAASPVGVTRKQPQGRPNPVALRNLD
mmetsp:Transcript_39487/g.121888  ORF Transcript_39487/g.121888 Transcript_39487/m.121888 type:complete len:275 (-) Transcript_39487:607-1431(-)